jgi:hypothetical protein
MADDAGNGAQLLFYGGWLAQDSRLWRRVQRGQCSEWPYAVSAPMQEPSSPLAWLKGDKANRVSRQFLMALLIHCGFLVAGIAQLARGHNRSGHLHLEAAKAEPDRLKHLMRRAFVTKRGLDRTIRSWAAEDKNVATIVAPADAGRIVYIAILLVATGVESRRAISRALIPVSALDDLSVPFEKRSSQYP